MKALLTAFALLSFVAASSLPMVASADEMKSDQTMSKPDSSMGDQGKSATTSKHTKGHKAATHKTHKKAAKKPTHGKSAKKHKTKPASTTPKAG